MKILSLVLHYCKLKKKSSEDGDEIGAIFTFKDYPLEKKKSSF